MISRTRYLEPNTYKKFNPKEVYDYILSPQFFPYQKLHIQNKIIIDTTLFNDIQKEFLKILSNKVPSLEQYNEKIEYIEINITKDTTIFEHTNKIEYSEINGNKDKYDNYLFRFIYSQRYMFGEFGYLSDTQTLFYNVKYCEYSSTKDDKVEKEHLLCSTEGLKKYNKFVKKYDILISNNFICYEVWKIICAYLFLN